MNEMCGTSFLDFTLNPNEHIETIETMSQQQFYNIEYDNFSLNFHTTTLSYGLWQCLQQYLLILYTCLPTSVLAVPTYLKYISLKNSVSVLF